jgi:hypothetical protein
MSYGQPGSPTPQDNISGRRREGSEDHDAVRQLPAYQVERAKSPAEIQRADEQAARLASAISSLFRGMTRPVRAVRAPSPAASHRLQRQA